MILDANGRAMVRRLGFLGGLEIERAPKRGTLVSLIGCERVWPEEDSQASHQESKKTRKQENKKA